MPTADHRETVGMVEERGTGLERDGLLACIDQIPILFALFRGLTETQNPVFGVIGHVAAFGLEFGDHLGEADAEVNVSSVFDILRRAPCDLRVRKLVLHDVELRHQ